MQYSIKQTKEEIKNGLRAYLNKDENGAYKIKAVNRIPYYLEGKPGIGKTEIVRQIADELGIAFVSFSITHHTRSTLLGLPVITDKGFGKYTEYTISEIIAAVLDAKEAGYEEGVLLLDEFNCASDTIMPAMLAFLQTRNIGRHTLPEGWSIVLCGNPGAYNKSARSFDAAILDRVRKLEVVDDVQDFLEYAKAKDFHAAVIDFLSVNRSCVYKCSIDTDEIVTCRSWENLSHILKMYEELGQDIDEKLISQYIKSPEISYHFTDFYGMFMENISKKDIDEVLSKGKSAKCMEVLLEKDFSFHWKFVDMLVHNIKNVNQVGKTIEFISCLNESASLLEKCLHALHQDVELVKLLLSNRCEPYLKLCRKSMGEMQTIVEAGIS